MKIKMLKVWATENQVVHAGQTINVDPDELGETLIRMGYAELAIDKEIEQAAKESFEKMESEMLESAPEKEILPRGRPRKINK